jgi:hypothetical protein
VVETGFACSLTKRGCLLKSYQKITNPGEFAKRYRRFIFGAICHKWPDVIFEDLSFMENIPDFGAFFLDPDTLDPGTGKRGVCFSVLNKNGPFYLVFTEVVGDELRNYRARYGLLEEFYALHGINCD